MPALIASGSWIRRQSVTLKNRIEIFCSTHSPTISNCTQSARVLCSRGMTVVPDEARRNPRSTSGIRVAWPRERVPLRRRRNDHYFPPPRPRSRPSSSVFKHRQRRKQSVSLCRPLRPSVQIETIFGVRRSNLVLPRTRKNERISIVEPHILIASSGMSIADQRDVDIE